MSDIFIRALWGVTKEVISDKFLDRRTVIAPEITSWKDRLAVVPFRTYAWGNENRDFLRSVGIEPVVIHEEPLQWEYKEHCWRHKLEAILRAFDDNDRVVWLDWDCVPQGPLPSDFWDRISEGEHFKACLKFQKHPQCPWREGNDRRYKPNCGFMYAGNRQVAEDMIGAWEETKPIDDEGACAWMTDGMMGGWKGPEEYCRRFEPYCVMGNRCGCCPPGIEGMKEFLFRHR